jgi:hypothetical protein
MVPRESELSESFLDLHSLCVLCASVDQYSSQESGPQTSYTPCGFGLELSIA